MMTNDGVGVDEDTVESRRSAAVKALTIFMNIFRAPALGVLPSAWRIAAINPITKAGVPPTTTDAARFITVQAVFNKMWRLLLDARAKKWAEEHGKLSDAQFGFRQRRSTEDAIFVLTGTLSQYMHSERKRTFAAFVDLRKAYDMVDREALLHKLEHMGVGSEFLRFLRMGFEDTKARVWLNGDASAPFPIKRGVPQGDPLSPLLFSLFIEDLLRELQDSETFHGLSVEASSRVRQALKVIAYADDIALVALSLEDLQRALDIVGAWATKWGMEVNTSRGKTEFMSFAPAGLTTAAVQKAVAKADPVAARTKADECATRANRHDAKVLQNEAKLAAAETKRQVAAPGEEAATAKEVARLKMIVVSSIRSAKKSRETATAAATAASAILATASAAATVSTAAVPVLLSVNGRRVAQVQRYDYLGYALNETLDAALPLRSRIPSACFNALRWRALAHGKYGLPVPMLAMTYMALVQPHLDYAAGVWGPPRDKDDFFHGYSAPPVQGGLSNPFSRAVKLQEECARQALGLMDSSILRQHRPTTSLVFASLGWMHQSSRWECARLRLLGNIVMAQEGSLLKAVARRLASSAMSVKGPDGTRRMVGAQWNWVAVTTELLKNIDAALPYERKLAPWLTTKSMLPVDPAKFGAEWRSASYDAINAIDGRDSVKWADELRGRDKGYAKAVRAAAAPIASIGAASIPMLLAEVVDAPGGKGKGSKWTSKEGPATCGTTSTARHIAQLTADKGGCAFGRNQGDPHIRLCGASRAQLARTRLRLGLAIAAVPGSTDDTGDADAAGRPAAAVVDVGSTGGCLWGQTTCPRCIGPVAVTLDAWHRLVECSDPLLVKARKESLMLATRLVTRWAAAPETRASEKEQAARAMTVLAEVEAAADTRPGRVFFFLAALAAPFKGSTAQPAALPEAWLELLSTGGGSKRAQSTSLSVEVIFRGFEPLVVAAARPLQQTAPEEDSYE
jgi:hypothetical protein